MESSLHFSDSLSKESSRQNELGSSTVTYDFTQESLENIPYPDDDSHKALNPDTKVPPLNDAESPVLPPDCIQSPYSSNKLQNISLPLDSSSCNLIPPAQIPLPANKNLQSKSELHLQFSSVPIYVDQSINNINNVDDENLLSKIQTNDCQLENITEEKIFAGSFKYSPSKVESDEENQDLIAIKPKVLGKEQAKKRLMAFSLSKQPNTTVKKQNKVIHSLKNIKEKPPNPNKGTGVQEQFRATISEIEEEKKKMMQNISNYHLMQMADTAKGTNIVPLSTISSGKESLKKDDNASNKLNESNKSNESNHKSREDYKISSSGKKSRSRSHSRRSSRSRSKQKKSSDRNRESNRSRKKSKNRSKSRSRSKSKTKSRSVTKDVKLDKSQKQDNKDINFLSKVKKLAQNWKSFKVSGVALDSEFRYTKEQGKESQKRKENRKRSRSPSSTSKHNFRPNFNYLKKNSKLMMHLLAKPANSASEPPKYCEKTIKYTRTKPMLIWSENPRNCTEFYMSRKMLLDNCDIATSSILRLFIKGELERKEDLEKKVLKNRGWYPALDFFLSDASILCDGLYPSGWNKTKLKQMSESPSGVDANQINKNKKKGGMNEFSTKNEEINFECKESWGKKRNNLGEKRINLVNDSYFSDEERDIFKVKEMVVGDVKVQLDLDLNSVKVRSKWDSDYEGDINEREAVSHTEMDMEIATSEEETNRDFAADKKIQPFENSNERVNDVKLEANLEKNSFESKNFISETLPKNENLTETTQNKPPANLASEYEEFLKMVSFDTDSNKLIQNSENLCSEATKMEISKVPEAEKHPIEISKLQFGMTDWDNESDHEEKTKTTDRKNESNEDFFLLNKEKSATNKKKKIKKTAVMRKKPEKLFKKDKYSKKSSKGKKRKDESSSSSDSSSDSYESESESDSDESKSSKKKKKKLSKTKKKRKKHSSSSQSESSSDSDTDNSKLKGKRGKKKKEKKKKKSTSSDSGEEKQSSFLKQLDIKKDLIMKKIEEIDSFSERSGKKKEKKNKKEKEINDGTDSLEKLMKIKKLKKSKSSSKFTKSGKDIKKRSSKSSSDTDIYDDSAYKSKRKKGKTECKKKRDGSESSDSDNRTKKVNKTQSKLDQSTEIKNLKSFEKICKKIKKAKKERSKKYSSSDSDSEDSSSKERKKIKGKGKKINIENENLDKEISNECSWKGNFSLKSSYNENNQLDFDSRKSEWKKATMKSLEKNKEKEKKSDDWEASSSPMESAAECGTRESWDDNVPPVSTLSKVFDNISDTAEIFKKEEQSSILASSKIPIESQILSEPDTTVQPSLISMKTSLSNYSFNENSFCGFGQELSRDFFLTEHNISNIVAGENNENGRCSILESRPFESVGKQTASNKSELYSPGHSYSDLSDVEENKSETSKVTKKSGSISKEEVYDPMNVESDSSIENPEVELSSIPLPRVSDILLPGESRFSKEVLSNEPKSELLENTNLKSALPLSPKSDFVSDFSQNSNIDFKDVYKVAKKKQVISVKSQPKLKSKAASVFQDESDEEVPDNSDKMKATNISQNENLDKPKKCLEEDNLKNKSKDSSQNKFDDVVEKRKDEGKVQERSFEKNDAKERREKRSVSREKSQPKERFRRRSRSKEINEEKNYRKNRSVSKERRNTKWDKSGSSSGVSRFSCRSPESFYRGGSKGKREIRSDSFEIEPLKSVSEFKAVEETVQPIPVLTGLGATFSERSSWNKPHLPGYSSTELSDVLQNTIDPSESFDIYPSHDLKHKNNNSDKICYDRYENSPENFTSEKSQKSDRKCKDRRRSLSKSLSPRKKRRSNTPEKRKSPKRRSGSPKRREKSPYSPKIRSPKRKGSSRRYRSSRSPDRRRKSRSRSPRKRRSRSLSPKHRSPKRRDSPRRRTSSSRTFSPRESASPRRNNFSNEYSDYPSRIPVIGNSGDDVKMSPTKMGANSMGYSRHMDDPSLSESDINPSFYNQEYAGEFGISNYSEEVTGSNLITLKNLELEKTTSPERLSLDQRIELELGVSVTSNTHTQNDQYQLSKPFQDMNSAHFQTSYNCDNSHSNGGDFYHNHAVPVNSDFNSQYYNGHQQSTGYGPFPQYSNPQPVQSSMMQVGNIVEVIPTMQQPSAHPPASSLKNGCHQIMQVGNVLQVVPSQKTTQSSPVPFTALNNYGTPSSTSPLPQVKTQKATAVVAPSSIVPTPNPEAVINPLIKAIQLEREKRKKEKEKRKMEREARRKARQLRREAKLMSVNEKLKKSVQDEGLMLGQDVEDDDLLDGLDLPSPPIPVEIITVSSPNILPAAGKGILITAGFMPKPPSEKKEVKFADGVCPGEGTSTSGGEDIATSPKPKLPKEKRYKKKRTKVKKKVKVQIIRQIIQDEDDDEDDDLSPPPPPPGDPPPVFFARFPFVGDAQFPVYQTQTTTTTLTTVQYPTQTF